jgi:tRNA threonylcarbamoyl adenosine modification protein YeaZ
MIIAAFDTSTNEASFTLLKDNEEIFSVTQECRRGASKLLPWINSLIKEAGYSAADIEKWYVGKGPGSFTGLRVGISFVKGICFGSGAKYMGVNSGLAYLHTFTEMDDVSEVTVLHDGRKNEVICNRLVRKASQWTESGVEVLRIDDLRPELFQGPLVTQMELDCFGDEIKNCITKVDSLLAADLQKIDSPFPESEKEMELSCEPIYVRPAVFVQPAKKR